MIIAIFCIFFISVSATYAADTNSNTNTTNSQNGIVNKDTNVNTTQQTVQSSNTNNAKTSTGVKAAGEPEKLTQSQILTATKTVNTYINNNKKLPNYVTIGGYDFSMQEYMYLLSKTIYYKYNKKTTQVDIKYNIKNPTSPTGATIKGSFTKAQYYSYAKSLITYVDKNNKIPNYLTTKLGKMQYQTAVYTFNKLLYYSATHNGALASSVSVDIAKTHTLNKNLPMYERSQAKTSTVTSSGSSKTLSQSLIWSAATSVKSYVDKNNKLPNYVTISGNNYSMPEFLYLLSKAINTKVGGSSGAITIKSGVKNPSTPSGATISKTFTKTQYNDMAKRVVSYINSYSKAPNYLSAKYGVGNIQYQTVIYGLSCVGNYINSKKTVPSSLSIKVASSNGMNKYLPVYSASTTNPNTPSGNTNNSNTNNNNSNGTANNNTNTNQTVGITTTLLGSNDKGKVELIGVFGNPNSNVKIAYVIGQHPLESQVHEILYNQGV